MGSVTGGTIDLERRYTIAELDELPEDGRRYELADGRLLVSPMASRRHQIGAQELGDVLRAACPPDLYVFGLPINVDDPDATHFEPDLTVVRRDARRSRTATSPCSPSRSAHRPPRAVTRCSSGASTPGSASASYWLLDVDVPSLRVLALQAGAYVEVAYGEGETPVSVQRPFPVTVVPARLLEV